MPLRELKVTTKESRQVIDITAKVQDLAENEAAACLILVAHTTCAITTADLDPGTDLDLLDAVLGYDTQARLSASAQSGARAGTFGQ